jgi:hypothetical protein
MFVTMPLVSCFASSAPYPDEGLPDLCPDVLVFGEGLANAIAASSADTRRALQPVTWPKPGHLCQATALPHESSTTRGVAS